MMKRLLLTTAIALLSFAGWSQCEIYFSYSVNDDTVTLVPFDSSSSIAYNEWSAAGGSPSFQSLYVTDTATVVYNSPGTYQICVVMYDTGWSCVDTFCDSVTITFGAFTASTTTSDETCGNCNGSASATPNGGSSPFSYAWSNGATTQSITGLCAGSYTVTVTDNGGATATSTATVINQNSAFSATINGATSACTGDTVTLTASANTFGTYTYSWNTGETTQNIGVTGSGIYVVTMTDSNGCTGIDSISVSFGSSLQLSMSSTDETCTSCCNGTATASIGGSGSYTYAWSNSASTASISNLCPGTYSVTVSNSSGCTATGSVTVNQFTSSCHNIAGEIAQGDLTRVYLIQESSGVLSAVDSTQTDSTGLFVFSNVCNGTYYVKGALLPAHSNYNNFVPTYYDSAAVWGAATSIIVNNASVYSVDFSLLAGTNSGGAGFIGGLISQGANRGEGDPVPNVWVIAYNEDGTVAGYDQTDANGEYNITDLSEGSYNVFVDILNKTSYPHQAVLTAENTGTSDRNFVVEGNMIKPVTPTGIAGVTKDDIQIYPNPVSDELNIQLGGTSIDAVKVYNMLGEMVMNNATNGTTMVTLDVSTLSSGAYMIEISANGGSHFERIMVK